MNSRRVHRVHAARRHADDALETYRLSNRGLHRVFHALVPEGDALGRSQAEDAAHHLAQVEAVLPQLREAVRSCRYPGAEHGDPGALLWGLWGHLSETLNHIQGAVRALDALGRRYRNHDGEGRRRRRGRKAARPRGGRTPRARAKSRR